MTIEEEFLIKEYESAGKLTFEIDTLRGRLTNFFLTLSGVAAGGLTLLIKGEVGDKFELPEGIIAVLMLLVAILGAVVVGILARLRKAQLEHFRIINNIRKYFLKKDYELWNIVELSEKTLPNPNRKSGTYLWVLLIIIVSAYLFAMSVYIHIFHIWEVNEYQSMVYLLSVICGLVFAKILDWIYLISAKVKRKPLYTEKNPPFIS